MALVDNNTPHTFKDLHAGSSKLASASSSPSKLDGSTTSQSSQSSPRGSMSPNSPVSVNSADSRNHNSSRLSRSPSPSIPLEASKPQVSLAEPVTSSVVSTTASATSNIATAATVTVTPVSTSLSLKVSSNQVAATNSQKHGVGSIDRPKKKYNVDKNKDKKQTKVNVAATGISTTIPVTGDRPRPEKHSSLDDEVLFTIFQILFDFDSNGKGMTVKQICDILLQKHPETAKLSSKTSNLVSAKLNAYVKRIEKGDKSLTYALSREWADTSPKRMVYVYRGILTEDFDVHAKAAMKSLEESFQHEEENKRLAAAAAIDQKIGSNNTLTGSVGLSSSSKNSVGGSNGKNQILISDGKATALLNGDWIGTKKTKKMSFSASDFAISGNVLINNNAKDNFDSKKSNEGDSKGSGNGKNKGNSGSSNSSSVSMKVTQLSIPFNPEMEKLSSNVTSSSKSTISHKRNATSLVSSPSSSRNHKGNGTSKSEDITDFMDDLNDSFDIRSLMDQPLKKQKLNNLTAAAAAPRVPKNFVNNNQSPGIVLAAAASLRAAALHALAPNDIVSSNGFLTAGQDIGNPEDISLAELDSLFK